ncbi:Crp/Fnr family transcriptional regulator [Sphingobacterium sp. JB170]|uniref:Crp/Fnr family transcriptional regulator n=1 Tax=Sphingobacterium sp. JB170 TaxID=1434842 RepID=UPI00097F39E2|nr:Crp/Fnr family transcriptional regulator [Sphingobacterium sp. JB170]SJN45848.1 cAMP-binding proteins-catabolite gene activator and regulatory subunit of cAMP-dependent protein kinases [Sphingobacterium sp. JB170]
MMEALVKYLLRFGHLNEQQIELIKANAEVVVMSKEEYFSEAGKTAKKVGFLQEGVMMICYYNNKGEEIVHHFINEDHFVVDLESFNYQTASMIYIKAVTDCTLLTFTHKRWNELLSTIMGFDELINKITVKTLLEKVNIIKPMLTVDAKDRYNNFLKDYPNLANRIPLVYVASFLGITPSSLSRIRNRVVGKGDL